MKEIVLKNWENGEGVVDFFNPDKPFDIKNEVLYSFGDHPVSPAEAFKRGFVVDKDFRLPAWCNDRIQVAKYVQENLGINRNDDIGLYYKTWSQLCEGLPLGNPDKLRPRTR
jgi:hypothetical protein